MGAKREPQVRSSAWLGEGEAALTHALNALYTAREANDREASEKLRKVVQTLDALILKRRPSPSGDLSNEGRTASNEN